MSIAEARRTTRRIDQLISGLKTRVKTLSEALREVKLTARIAKCYEGQGPVPWLGDAPLPRGATRHRPGEARRDRHLFTQPHYGTPETPGNVTSPWHGRVKRITKKLSSCSWRTGQMSRRLSKGSARRERIPVCILLLATTTLPSWTCCWPMVRQSTNRRPGVLRRCSPPASKVTRRSRDPYR